MIGELRAAERRRAGLQRRVNAALVQLARDAFDPRWRVEHAVARAELLAVKAEISALQLATRAA